MKFKIILLIFSFYCTSILKAQEKNIINWDYKGQPFTEFVLKAKSQLNIKFFYKDEWVKDLILGDYAGNNTLQDILNNLLRGKSLFYFIDEAGNVVITRNWAVKISDKVNNEGVKFIPPTEYADTQDDKKIKGNTVVEIGNPADRNKPGNVVISGYITNKDTKEPVAGVTVYNQKLSLGTISNEYGFYTLTLPRGIHILQFSFIGMKEKIINLNLNGAGEMNVEMNSMLIPLKETVVSAQKKYDTPAI